MSNIIKPCKHDSWFSAKDMARGQRKTVLTQGKHRCAVCKNISNCTLPVRFRRENPGSGGRLTTILSALLVHEGLAADPRPTRPCLLKITPWYGKKTFAISFKRRLVTSIDYYVPPSDITINHWGKMLLALFFSNYGFDRRHDSRYM